MKKERGYGLSNGSWKAVAFGIGVGLVTMLVLAGAFAWMIQREIIGAAHMGLAAVAVLMLGGFLGAVCSGRGEGRFVRSGAVAAGLIMVLLLINLAVYDGSLGGLLPGAAAVIGSAGAAALVLGGGSGNRRGKHRYRKYGNR